MRKGLHAGCSWAQHSIIGSNLQAVHNRRYSRHVQAIFGPNQNSSYRGMHTAQCDLAA